MNTSKIRETYGLSQRELAAVLGVHKMSVSKWERGAAAPPDRVLPWLGLLQHAAAPGQPPKLQPSVHAKLASTETDPWVVLLFWEKVFRSVNPHALRMWRKQRTTGHRPVRLSRRGQ